MGAGLVRHALAPEWAILNSTERLVLVTMSLHALDPGQGKASALYWGGTDYLISVLRGTVPEDPGEYNTARVQVRRALRRLQEVGAIHREVKARGGLAQEGGNRARYRIQTMTSTLDNPVDESVDNPVDNPPRLAQIVALRGT